MDPLRIALLASPDTPDLGRLMRDPYRGTTWDLVSEHDRPDYILAAGSESGVTPEMLEQFPQRVLAIHDADLSIRERALYMGPHAVRYAILAGEPETRSSVYIATREPGRGPLLLLSAPFPVSRMAQEARLRGDADFLRDYADLHRRWMVAACWGEMLARTIELLAGGTMKILGDTVWFDGAPGPCRMGESPSACHEPEAMLARGIPRSCPFIG